MAIGAIGKYERLEILGHGASGIVYLAWDTLLRRHIALKEIRAAAPEVERVLSEARVLDRLRHPNIIEVHSVDVQDGVILLDMELVRGKNLADVLRERAGAPLAPAAAVQITHAVLDALAYAHERRILHKDVKPANILIGADGTTVKLTDFGLAEALGSGSVAGGGGTYPYMAPEDFSEDAASDYRSDLWAVGVVLYELLTGQRPFAVTRSKDPFSWKRAVETETPQPPSTLVPDLSPALDAVVLRALAKDKTQRYPNARAFAEALDAAQAGLPAATEPLIAPTVAPPPTERKPVWERPEGVWLFPDGTEARTLDTLLAGAAKNWDDSRRALSDGRLTVFLKEIGEPYIAELAAELVARADLGPDRRLREFLERARPDEPLSDEEKTVPLAALRARLTPLVPVGGQAQRVRPPEPIAAVAPAPPERLRFRWWFPLAFLACLAPTLAALGIPGRITGIPPVVTGLAVTGMVSAMLLLVAIGCRLPVWARIVCLFPVALGVMAAGIVASRLIDGYPTPERLLTLSIAALLPLGMLLIQAATARRLWRLWLTLTLLAAAIGTALCSQL